MLIEEFSFGAVSRIYKVTKGGIRKPVADALCLQQDILQSWLHALVFVRNLCAHSCRVWNRVFTIKPKIPKQYAPHVPPLSQALLYAVCVILQHIMVVIAEESQWSDRLRLLLNERPGVALADMGFPENWDQLPPGAGRVRGCKTRMLTMRISVLVLFAGLAGCAQGVWTKDGATQHDFASDSYACEKDTRQSGYFGTGVIGAVNMHDFAGRCMVAHGWHLVSQQQAPPALQFTVEQWDAARAECKTTAQAAVVSGQPFANAFDQCMKSRGL
jgi:hypothetical protein